MNEFLSWGYGADYVDAFNYNEWMLDYAGGVENLPEVVVAVIDTGYDSDHPYLVGRSVPGYDFVTTTATPRMTTATVPTAQAPSLTATFPTSKSCL